ncbi:hypothetical protein AX16_006885 [Volvariella volvacea WC 439]|nr:hypothetical protein AX16_006885 [Volvariella volvacea WC 439]
MSTPHIHSASSLRREIDTLKHKITQPETEETWDAISDGLSRLTFLCTNGGGEYPDDLVPHLRSFSRPICSAMLSERTRLSGVAIDLVSSMATALGGTHFEPLLPLYFPTLLILCSRTNKVVVTRARACILAVIETTQLPAILTYFVHNVKDKASSLRLVVAEGTLACLNCFNPPDIEKESRAVEVETIIKTTARDASADVRKVGKQIFEAYKQLLADRLPGFAAPLTPTIKKYLNIQSLPSSSQTQAAPPRPSSRAQGHLSKMRSISNLAATASSNPPPRPPSRALANNATSTGPSRATRAEPLASSTSSREAQRLPPSRTRTISTSQAPPPVVSSRPPPQVMKPQRPAPTSSTTASVQSGPRRVYAPQPPPPESKAPAPVSAGGSAVAGPSSEAKPAKVAASSTAPPAKAVKKPMLPPPVPTARERTTSTRSNASTSSAAASAVKTVTGASTSATGAASSKGKERSLTQPTLAQLARMQTKKITTTDTKPASKPSTASSKTAAVSKPTTAKAAPKPQPTHTRTGSTATTSSAAASTKLTKSTSSLASSTSAKGKGKMGPPPAPVKGKSQPPRPPSVAEKGRNKAQPQKPVGKREPENVPLPPSPVPGAKGADEKGIEIESENVEMAKSPVENLEDEEDLHEQDHEEEDEGSEPVDEAEHEDELDLAAETAEDQDDEHDEHDDEQDNDSEETIVQHADTKVEVDGEVTSEAEEYEDTERKGLPVVEHHLSQDLTTLTSKVTASTTSDSLNKFGYPTPPTSNASSTATKPTTANNGNPNLAFSTPQAPGSDELFSLHAQAAKTPISALLSSIHHGFLFSPSSPLSPPSSYTINEQNAIVGPPIAKPQFGGSLNIVKSNSANQKWNPLERERAVRELEAEFEHAERDMDSDVEKDGRVVSVKDESAPREILKAVDVN